MLVPQELLVLKGLVNLVWLDLVVIPVIRVCPVQSDLREIWVFLVPLEFLGTMVYRGIMVHLELMVVKVRKVNVGLELVILEFRDLMVILGNLELRELVVLRVLLALV